MVRARAGGQAEAPDSIAVPAMARVLAGLPRGDTVHLVKRRLCMLESGQECAPTLDDSLTTAAYRVLRTALGPEPAPGARARARLAISRAILRGDSVQFLLESSGCVTPFRDEPINFSAALTLVSVSGFGHGEIREYATHVSDGFSPDCVGADRIRRERTNAARR